MPRSQARKAPREGGYQHGLDLGEERPPADAPLAARMRPRTLDEFVGQEKAVGPGSMLARAIKQGQLPSIVLWGPPGCGKTTLARLLARAVEAEFVQVSAVSSGVADLRKHIADAAERRRAGVRTTLFIDEIHRFNKAQQDVVLPHVEDGTITLIGATTENPSFEVIAPLLSRVRVIRLLPLGPIEVAEIVNNALTDEERGLGSTGLAIDADAMHALVQGTHGDARAALTAVEIASRDVSGEGRTAITEADVVEALQDRRPYHDRGGDYHYDTVSALIKSIRGSDPDAALYWLARMVEGGEDPLFIVRRLVVLAAEDVGLADPQALGVAVACQQAVHFVGMPEGALPMAECVTYLALAPKSNSAYMGYQRASEDVQRTLNVPVPMHLRNAPTAMMREMGYGQGYRYAHNEPGHVARGERYLPEEVADARYYEPGSLGAEAEIVREHRRLEASPPDGPAGDEPTSP